MSILKKILGIWGVWIVSYLLYAFVVEKCLNIQLEGNLIGLGIIIWPIILFTSYIIKTIINFTNKKEIKLAKGYGILLGIIITSNATGSISNLSLVNQELSMNDEVMKSKNNKLNMILNILMYIVTIISLLLFALINESWKFVCITIMYGVLVCIPIVMFFKNTKKARKENIDAIARDANISKRKLIIISLLGVLIFLIPLIIIGIIWTDFEMNEFGELNKTEIVQPNNDINVKDDNYTESELSKEDYKKIEEEISSILNGEIVYREVAFEGNLKNIYGERYNKL